MEILVGIIPGIVLSILFLLKYKNLFWCLKVKDSTYLEVLFYAVFGVAIFEEGFKWFITLLVSFFSKIEDSYDIVTYAIFASIGFLTFENVIYYVIPYGMGAAISRMFTSIPSHICFAVIMGYFLQIGLERKEKNRYIFYFLGLIIPTFIHAFYNSFLYGRKFIKYFDVSFMLIIILSIVLFVIMEYKRRKQKTK